MLDIIIYHPESNYFQNYFNDVFTSLDNWLKSNKLTLHFDKTNVLKFSTNKKTCINLSIGYDDRIVEEVGTNEFLGVQIDKN